MFKRWIHRREKRLAMLNDNRVVRPFEWGTEFISRSLNGKAPRKVFRKHANEMVEDSDSFYSLSKINDYKFDGERLFWTSPIKTSSLENNTAYAHFFPHRKDKKAAVVVLPHWNARAKTYFDLCSFFNKVGISSLRLTLPYHEERMPSELERADYLVSPNVGRTIESVRQSVLDTKASVYWLKKEGYEKIGIVGTSIGSCVAFLAFTHDKSIDAAVFNHVSGYFADVVWRGLSTYHVREGFGTHISLEELREFWAPISPMIYMEKLADMPERPQRYIYTLYDLSFPLDLTHDTMRALNNRGINHDEVSIPCGHYTLGESPWVYLDGYKIISFLRKHLR